jgi:hypothetical protein
LIGCIAETSADELVARVRAVSSAGVEANERISILVPPIYLKKQV